ncbi:MAG: PAS domain S-box protein, partial [Planctomycetota bacterium]
HGELTLEEGASLGEYRIVAEVGGATYHSSFTVPRALEQRPGPRAAIWNAPPGADHAEPIPVALAPLWDGHRVIGWIAADNLLTRRALDDRSRELLAMYAATLGHLVTQRRTEEALRESEQRYALAERAARIGSWEWDVRTGRGVWSAAMEEIAGLDPGRFGGTFDDLKRHIHPDDLRAMKAAFDACARGEGGYDVEYRFVRADGSVRWVRDVGRLLSDAEGRSRVVGACMDITGRKEAEAALRESEARYRALFDSAPVGIGVATLEGEPLEGNYAMMELVGRTREGVSLGDVADAYRDPKTRAELIRRLQQDGAVRGMETELLRPDGTVRQVSLNVTQITLQDEPCVLTVAEDITERKEAEEQIRRMNEELEDRVARRTRELEEANKRLRESEERYRAMWEAVPDAVAVYDPETGIIVEANEALYDMYGYTDAELRARADQPYWPTHPDDREAMRRLTEELEPAPGPRRFPRHRRVRKDGSTFWAESTSTDFELGGRRLRLGITRDVTEQVEAERALRESEERLRTITENSPDLITLLHPDGRILFQNYTLSGIPPDELVGTSVYDHVPTAAAETIRASIDRVLETGEMQSYEIEYRSPDEQFRCFEARMAPVRRGGQIVALALNSHDITHRRRAAEALRESEERYRGVFETAPLAFVIWDLDCRVTDWNPHAEQVFGWSADEVLGRDFFEFIIPEHARPNVREVVNTMIEERFPKHNVNDNLTKGGGTITCEWRNYVLRDGRGNVTGAVSLGLDITERLRAEEEVRRSQALLRAAVESMPFDFFALGNDGRYILENSVCREHWGDLIGQRPEDVDVPADARERWLSNNRRAFAGQTVHEETAYTVGSEKRHLYNIIAPIRADDQPLGILGINIDITERKEAEEALRESEERYRRVVEDQTELICRFVEDGTLTFVNGAYRRYFGKTEAELLGHSFTPLIPEEERPKDRSHIRSLSREQPVGTVEHRVVRPDGSTRWMQWTNRMLFDDQGEFVEYQAVGRDITEQVEARRRIEYQSLLLENVTDAIAVITRQRRLAFWNLGGQAIFGYTMDELARAGGLHPIVRDAEQARELDREIEAHVDRRQVWAHPRLACRHQDGSDVWCHVRMFPLGPGPWGGEAALFIIRDITDEVALEQRLITSQRMATVGTLAMSVAHELNNLLGGLRGLAEMADERADLVPRLVDACRAVAERGGTIAGRMSSLAKADTAGEERRINIADVARTVVSMMEPSISPRGISVQADYRNVPLTWANEGKILQILLNLITNARDSIGRDGIIRVTVRHEPEPDHITVAVADSGDGVRPEDVERLFTPFFTTKRGDGGEDPTHLGLGLSESMSLARQYGGTIGVDSAVGEGATFTVRLPVRSAPTAVLEHEIPAAELPPAGTRMLVADDDELIRLWLGERLAGHGYEVVEAAGGREAVDACREQSFAYVFIDMLMPGEIDGVAAFRTLKQQMPDARMIIATAFPPENIPDDCRGAAFAVLKKPFGPDDLTRALAGQSGRDMGEEPAGS